MGLWWGLSISSVASFSYMAELCYTNQTFLHRGRHNTICHYYIWSLFLLISDRTGLHRPTTDLDIIVVSVTFAPNISNIFSFALFHLQSSIHFFDWPTNKHRGNLFVRCSHPIINVIFRRNICRYKLAADQSELFLTQTQPPNENLPTPRGAPSFHGIRFPLNTDAVAEDRTALTKQVIAEEAPSTVLIHNNALGKRSQR